MSNKVKDIDISKLKVFIDMANIKNLMQIMLKSVKSHTKIILFAVLDM